MKIVTNAPDVMKIKNKITWNQKCLQEINPHKFFKFVSIKGEFEKV